MKYVLSLLALCACGEQTVLPPELVSFTVDPAIAQAGDELTTTVEVAHFTLTGEEEHAHDEMAMDDHHDGDGSDATGHVHIYLDDLETSPLAMQVTSVGTLIIPEGTELGDHVLIGRLHDSSHLIIEPQVILEIDLQIITP
ncbi:MAG: hypothetical protein GWP91_11145 [Rhodobacterales bacterium]|nr:hypothetical protein [Rhodobacterales bacterium]